MKWREYEIYIRNHFKKLFPEAEISHDVKRMGVISETNRQIDILIEGKIAGIDLSIIVDCKYFNKKVTITTVESFLSFLRDVKASKGILITNKGYSQNAYNRATYDSQDIELRIINFDDLEHYQGFMAIPYAGKDCLLISAPEGWIIDNTRCSKFLATLYPAGLKFEELESIGEGFIYLSYSKKDPKLPTMQSLLKIQDDNIFKHHKFPRVEYIETIEREDCVTKLRVLDTSELKEYYDYTLFLDFPDIIFFFCSITPKRKEKIYLKKLKWVAEKAIKGTIIVDQKGKPISAELVGRKHNQALHPSAKSGAG